MLNPTQIQATHVPKEVKLDEAMWEAWKSKGEVLERGRTARRLIVINCAVIGVLTAVLFFWGNTSYDRWIRFAISLGALIFFVRAGRLRRYIFAGSFAALIVAYNPIVPLFPFAGGVSFGFVVLTLLIFAVSLMRLRSPTPARESVQTAFERNRNQHHSNQSSGSMNSDVSTWENEGGGPAATRQTNS